MKTKMMRISNFLSGSLVALSMFFVTGVALAQTSTTTPGTPTTGAGGDMLLNLVILAFAALLIAAGVAYAQKERV